jgi:enoyl-[acyl-carrier protein] reductase I
LSARSDHGECCGGCGERAAERAPARKLVRIEDVGIATAYLATDYAKLVPGETIYVDGGYHILG